VKKTEDEVCGYWPNSSCAGRVVGYTVIESQRDDKPVPLCFAHFNDTQLDNLAYRKRKLAAVAARAT
jgi:hypothetical protein